MRIQIKMNNKKILKVNNNKNSKLKIQKKKTIKNKMEAKLIVHINRFMHLFLIKLYHRSLILLY